MDSIENKPKKEFDKDLKYNIIQQHTRVTTEKLASVILIDGFSGQGKTNLAVQIADIINAQDGFEQVKLELSDHPQLGMGSQEFLKQVPICYEAGYHVIIYDEGGDFNRRSFMSKVNAILNRVFETYRAYKVIVIICLPNFWKLDKSLFELALPRFLIHVHGKKQDKGYGKFKAYSLHRIYGILNKLDKRSNKATIYKEYRPNLHGNTYNLPTERSNKLETLSTRSKLSYVKAQGHKIKGLSTIKEISERFTIPRNTIRNQIISVGLKQEKIENKVYLNDSQIALLKSKFKWGEKKKKVTE